MRERAQKTADRSQQKTFRLLDSTALPYNCAMVFVETSAFTKQIGNYLSDDEYRGLQQFLLNYPEEINDV
jgi:hypothetical protein